MDRVCGLSDHNRLKSEALDEREAAMNDREGDATGGGLRSLPLPIPPPAFLARIKFAGRCLEMAIPTFTDKGRLPLFLIWCSAVSNNSFASLTGT
jgi:hypothetical protein